MAADLNGDGKPDLVVANANTYTMSVLLNDGSGSFAAKHDYATGAWPLASTAADFNGDGWIDLAVACEDSNSVSVLLTSCLP